MKTSYPRAEIVAVGAELLSPYFQDTDSLYLTERLEEMGIAVAFRTIVGDDREDLRTCLRTALRRSRLVIVSGGLGPTEDDRTREVAAEVLGRGLTFDERIRKAIRDRFRGRGLGRMSRSNRRQCYVIDGADALPNAHGTAPGQWVAERGRVLVLLPGPPRELEPMFEASVAPRLAGGGGFTVRRVLKVTGLPESRMEDKLRAVYPKLPAGTEITTLAYPADLQVRLTVRGRSDRPRAERAADRATAMVARRLGEQVYAVSDESLESVVARLLTSRRLTVACAESCTGGLLSHRLTNVPGSSSYFLEGIVAYGDRAKVLRLGVPRALLEAHGAVSAPVAEAMARGIRSRSGAHFGIGITGIAGPGGGSPDKPVGLVHIALAWGSGVASEKALFRGEREIVKFLSAQKALDMLRRKVLTEAPENAP